MIEGFDASGWSGNINFRAAKEAGKQYGIYRVGRGVPDGATDQYGVDKLWKSNKAGSINAGLKTGGYWRFFPNLHLGQQVDRFVTALGQTDGMLDPWVDVEDTGGLDPRALTDWVLQCLGLVKQKTGRYPVLYTGKNFYDTNLQYWRISAYKLAIAWQTTGKWREYGAHFWQYLLDTPVPWSTGKVDLQRFAFDDLNHELFKNELLYKFDEDGMLHGPLVYSDKLLPESGKQGTQSNNVFIVHTMVGYLNGSDSYFRRGDITLESNLGIGGKYDGIELDGAIYQWMRLQDRADANFNANSYAFSVETSDGGGLRYLEPWTPLQNESVAQSAAAWCLVTGRPARIVNRAHSTVHGIGHHRIGTVPYVNPGDDYWSPPDLGARACPGQPRIDQLTNATMVRVKAILNSLDSSNIEPPVDEDEMTLDDIVGYHNNRAVTVREALLAAYSIHDLMDELNKMPYDIKKTVIEKGNEVIDLMYTFNGQSTWEDLSSITWGDLADNKWSSL